MEHHPQQDNGPLQAVASIHTWLQEHDRVWPLKSPDSDPKQPSWDVSGARGYSVHFHYVYFKFYSQKWQKNHRVGLFQAVVYVITHCPLSVRAC